MKRRLLIKNALSLGQAVTPFTKLLSAPAGPSSSSQDTGTLPVAGPRKPVTIYNNWSAYDEISDNIPLTEALAMRELDELVWHECKG